MSAELPDLESPAFRPDTTVEALVGDGRGHRGVVRVGGRLISTHAGALALVDGQARLEVRLAAEERPTALDGAPWVAIEAWWHAEARRLERARVVFASEGRLSLPDAAAQRLPETAFVRDPRRLEAVRTRARLLRCLRSHLDGLGYLEVQTPFLRAQPEAAHVQQCSTRGANDRLLYLRTDPEEYLKRYLTAGLEAVYEVSTNVRAEVPDRDHLHEFTSIECYRRFASFAEMVTLCCDLVAASLLALRGETRTRLHGAAVDLTPPVGARPFRELLIERAGIDVDQYPTAGELAHAVTGRGWWQGTGGPQDAFRRTWLEWLLDRFVLRELDRPLLVVDFPTDLGLSARERPDDPSVCLRGELYLPGGLELAQIYENLTEPAALRERYEERLRHRIAAGLPEVAVDDQLLGSAEIGMPPMSGLALGVDRLLLLVLGEGAVGEGLLFPREGFPEDAACG